MSIVTNSLKNLSSFLQDHQVSFSNGLLILFTIGGEQIFKSTAFKCPCTQPTALYYALIFMLVPFVVLAIIGIAVSNLTWRIFHGCSNRETKSENGKWNSCAYCSIVFARALIVPFAWLFLTFLDGDYYACMWLKEPCGNQTASQTGKKNELKTESQIIGWLALGAVIVVSFFVICIVRCYDSVTYEQYKYISAYREAEQKQLDAVIQERSKKLAETNVGVFMDQKKLNKEDWDDISRVPDPKIDLSPTVEVPTLTDSKKERGEGDHPQGSVKVESSFLTYLHKWASQHEQKEETVEERSETKEQLKEDEKKNRREESNITSSV